MISNKCYYALRAVLELAVREGDGPITIGDIATARGIPVRFLEAILRQVKQAGLADSARGKDGGYSLARPAHRITVGEVVRLFEGPMLAVSAQVERATPGSDVFVGVWQRGEAALAGALDSVTFGSLAERERALDAAHAENYTI
jgi:Rrf2 family transcriptional regulator, cysteine metabolism repressor